MTTSFRIATAADAGLLAELGARTFKAAFGDGNTAQDMDAYLAEAFGRRIQKSQIADPTSTFLLAEVDGEVAGFAQLRTAGAPPCVDAERPIEIARLYADLPWIGAGVGSALMGESIERARAAGHDVIWLDVWERNPRAIRFYERWGFATVGEQVFVLGSDAQRDLVMRRALS